MYFLKFSFIYNMYIDGFLSFCLFILMFCFVFNLEIIYDLFFFKFNKIIKLNLLFKK